MPAVACPNNCSPIHLFGFVFSQTEYNSFLQASHTPQAIGNGTTTRSPTFKFLTSRPTSTTSPMNSWPSTSPDSMVGTNPLTRCRSEPQIAVDVTRTMASRALRMDGSGTSSTETLRLPSQHVAFMLAPASPGSRRHAPKAGRDGSRGAHSHRNEPPHPSPSL